MEQSGIKCTLKPRVDVLRDLNLHQIGSERVVYMCNNKALGASRWVCLP